MLFFLSDAFIGQNQFEGLAELYAEGLLLAQQSGNSKVEAQFRARQAWLTQQTAKNYPKVGGPPWVIRWID